MDGDLQRRRAVWRAMSDLFRASEVRPSLPRTALICLDSGFPRGDLRWIWRHEVVPFVVPLSRQVPGVERGFDLDALALHAQQPRFRALDWLWCRQAMGTWRQLTRLMDWLETWPADERRGAVTCVQTLTWVALHGEKHHGLRACTLDEAQHERAWNEAAAPLVKALHRSALDPDLRLCLARGADAVCD